MKRPFVCPICRREVSVADVTEADNPLRLCATCGCVHFFNDACPIEESTAGMVGDVVGRPLTALFSTDYSPIAQWQAVQAPPDRVSVDSSMLRCELQPGDTSQWGHRAEVYARHAVPGTTPPENWPDPVGCTRRIEVTVLFPQDFQTSSTTDSPWFTFSQLKGFTGGSPVLAFELRHATRIYLGGKKASVDLGSFTRGVPTTIALTVTLSPDPAIGRVRVERDGVLKVDRSQATMDVYNGKVDAVYWKQGIYRSTAWTVPQVLYFGPTVISEA